MSLQDRITEVLDAVTTPATALAIAAGVSARTGAEQSPHSVQTALTLMVRDGEVKPVTRGRYALPWTDDYDAEEDAVDGDTQTGIPETATPPVGASDDAIDTALQRLEAAVRPLAIANLDRKLAVLERLGQILDDSIGAVLASIAADLKRAAA